MIATVLLAGALISVRTPVGGVAAVVLALGIVTVAGVGIRTRVRALATVVVSTALAIAPWSFAAWRAVGTPLYPFFAGNVNASGPAADHLPVDGVSSLATQAFALVNAGPFLWIALAIFVLALLTHRVLPDPGLIAVTP